MALKSPIQARLLGCCRTCKATLKYEWMCYATINPSHSRMKFARCTIVSLMLNADKNTTNDPAASHKSPLPPVTKGLKRGFCLSLCGFLPFVFLLLVRPCLAQDDDQGENLKPNSNHNGKRIAS